MRVRVAACLIGLGLIGQGCTLVHNAARTVCYQVAESVEECAERARNRKWAAESWDRFCMDNPDGDSTADYADGFHDGFADYLFYGGDGEPPPLPPRHYRALRYQSPEGYRAIEDWFAGYRHGATLAEQGGYRRLVTGPSALPCSGPPPLPECLPAVLPPPEKFMPAPEQLHQAEAKGRAAAAPTSALEPIHHSAGAAQSMHQPAVPALPVARPVPDLEAATVPTPSPPSVSDRPGVIIRFRFGINPERWQSRSDRTTLAPN